jgi:hypothetical protein
MNVPASFETRSADLFREWTARFLGTASDAGAEQALPAAVPDPVASRRASRLPTRIWDAGTQAAVPRGGHLPGHG